MTLYSMTIRSHQSQEGGDNALSRGTEKELDLCCYENDTEKGSVDSDRERGCEFTVWMPADALPSSVHGVLHRGVVGLAPLTRFRGKKVGSHTCLRVYSLWIAPLGK